MFEVQENIWTHVRWSKEWKILSDIQTRKCRHSHQQTLRSTAALLSFASMLNFIIWSINFWTQSTYRQSFTSNHPGHSTKSTLRVAGFR